MTRWADANNAKPHRGERKKEGIEKGKRKRKRERNDPMHVWVESHFVKGKLPAEDCQHDSNVHSHVVRDQNAHRRIQRRRWRRLRAPGLPCRFAGPSRVAGTAVHRHPAAHCAVPRASRAAARVRGPHHPTEAVHQGCRLERLGHKAILQREASGREAAQALALGGVADDEEAQAAVRHPEALRKASVGARGNKASIWGKRQLFGSPHSVQCAACSVQ